MKMKLRPYTKTLVFIVAIFVSLQNSFAIIQPGDSIMGQLAGYNSQYKVSRLIKILESNPNIPHLLSIDYAQEGIKWSHESDNDEDLAKLYNYLGNKYYVLGEYENSLVNYQNALRIALRIGEKEEIAILMQKLGIINYNKSEYKKSLLYFQQTLKIYQELGFSMREAELYNSIGSIFYNWHEYEKALENYDLAYNIYKELDHIPNLANALYLKGLIMQKLFKYDESIVWFNKALVENTKLDNKNSVVKIHNAIGESYMFQKKYEDALSQFMIAYRIQEKISDRIILAQSLNNLGNVYKELGQFELSNDYLNKSIDISIELDLKLTLIDNYKSYYELYYLQNQSSNALKYYQLYINLRDSVFNTKGDTYTNFLTGESHDKEMLELKKVFFESQKRSNVWIIILLIAVVLLVVVVGVQRRNLNKKRLE